MTQEAPKPQPTELDKLTEISDHLNSIRKSVTFFVVMTLIIMVLGACNILFS